MSQVGIDFLNIRGIRGKIHEVNKHLDENSPDIFCLAETFLRSNNKPRDLHTRYNWVGKCRGKNDKDKGGIGISYKDELQILDENLIESQNDEYERLWILVRLNGTKTAIGVAYFPNDGVNKVATDKLFYELLENCSLFRSCGYEVCLTGDFNGRCLDKCELTGETILSTKTNSYNGVRSLQFVEATALTVANSVDCCQGFFTRILNNQKSAIDYILLSKDMADTVCTMYIDEEGHFDLHSDHVILSIKLKKLDDHRKKSCDVDNRSFWKITDTTDWEFFCKNLVSNFNENWSGDSNDINEIWSIWKEKVNRAAELVIKKVPMVKKLSEFLG